MCRNLDKTRADVSNNDEKFEAFLEKRRCEGKVMQRKLLQCVHGPAPMHCNQRMSLFFVKRFHRQIIEGDLI
ncbi:hypothetical protein AQ910_01735 [Burkholderia pseudomallei]|nr:hypothetical protein AQ910_01735 [Burkholderia pseudomallei]